MRCRSLKRAHSLYRFVSAGGGMAETIGDRIRLVRGASSQKEFASVLGVHEQTLGKYERDKLVPGGDILAVIHEKCGVDINWLLTGQGQMRREEGVLDPACSSAAFEAQAVAAAFYGQVLEQVAAVYKECGVTASLAQIGAEAAEIAGDLSSPDFPTAADKAIGLKGSINVLRRRLQAANQAQPGGAQGKQSA